MTATNKDLRQELLAMRAEDFRVREELAATGELFDGYHPRMEAVHLENARRVEEMLAEYGWLGKSLVGEDGADAAWIIVQHAISRPDLQRKMLPLFKQAAQNGENPPKHFAFLEDRILFFEGKPQIYGSQFDWNERGELSPNEIFEPENIDERRAAVGLETPYSEYIKAHNEAVRKSNEKPPDNLVERQRKFEEWARQTGWR